MLGFETVDVAGHCWVTSATVGYGDVSINRPESRMVASFHIFVSVSWLAAFAGRVTHALDQRRLQIERARLILTQLDSNMVNLLDKDGNGVDRTEFVVGLLTALGVTLCGQPLDFHNDVQPLLDRFDTLDRDKSGRLERADLEFMVSESRRSHDTRRGHIRDASNADAFEAQGSSDELAAALQHNRGRRNSSTATKLSAGFSAEDLLPQFVTDGISHVAEYATNAADEMAGCASHASMAVVSSAAETASSAVSALGIAQDAQRSRTPTKADETADLEAVALDLLPAAAPEEVAMGTTMQPTVAHQDKPQPSRGDAESSEGSERISQFL